MRFAELVLMSVLVAGAAGAQGTPCDSPCKVVPPPRSIPRGRPTEARGPVYFDYEVEKSVQPVPNGIAPQYPDSLKAAKVEGEVMVSFVVNTLGRADTATLKIVRSTHDLFSQSVRATIPLLQFQPAEIGGIPVMQLVMQPFVFKLSR